MTVFNRIWRFLKGTNRSGMVHMTGSFTVGSSGAVASSDTPGFTVAKVDSHAGQYTIQCVASDGSTAAAPAQPLASDGSTPATPWGIQAIHAMVVSAVATGTALTKDSPVVCAVRNFLPASGKFDLQFCTLITSSGETHVDAQLESGAIVLLSFMAKCSSVTP